MSSNFALSRRHFLGGSTAVLLSPAADAAAPPTEGLKPLLDRAAAASSRGDMLQIVRTADASRFNREDAAILRMIVRGIEREEALHSAFPFGKVDGSSPYVVSQRHGAWLDVGGKAHPATLSRRLDEETERLRAEAARGIVPPAFILDAVIEGERARLASPMGLALAHQITVLESLRTKAPPEAGFWQLPGGAQYYALRLQCTTGSDLSPAELDRLVGIMIGALTGRANALLKRLGLTHGSVGARLRGLKQRPEYLYDNDGAGRARAVADMNAALARLRPHLPIWFNPPFEPGSSVKLMSAADEKAGKRGYRDPPSATAPGAYYPDLSNVHDRPSWTLTTVAYHETIPGHMIQLRRQEIADPHPLQIRYAAGYAEGWAIYAESLADRIGILSPVDQIGFIQSWLFRLARVAADLGMHFHRWDRARALRFLEETVGFELFFPFAVEVDRYAAEPAGFAGDGYFAIMLRALSGTPPIAWATHDAALNRGPISFEALSAIL